MGKTREKSSFLSYCDVKEGYKRQVCIHVVRTYVHAYICLHEIRGTVGSKLGIWQLRGMKW